MVSFLRKPLLNIFNNFFKVPTTLNFSKNNNFSTKDKLNTKSNTSLFTDMFSYVYSTTLDLLSVQKIQYLGLHTASAARWVKIRVSYALNS